jgi:hypothetical protein
MRRVSWRLLIAFHLLHLPQLALLSQVETQILRFAGTNIDQLDWAALQAMGSLEVLDLGNNAHLDPVPPSGAFDAVGEWGPVPTLSLTLSSFIYF